LLTGPKHQGDEAVCVSIVAHEEAEWIDILLENLMRFADRSTKVALHISNATTASKGSNTWESDRAASLRRATQKKMWESDRVAVSRQRSPVLPESGGVFMAHLKNARRLDEKWPDTCKYFVMQSSTMLWVRPGFEKRVRRRRYGQAQESAPSCSAKSSLTAALTQPHGLVGCAPSDGNFVPMDTVRRLDVLLQSRMRTAKQDESAVIDTECPLEDYWLPTFVLNFDADKLPKDHTSENLPLGWKHVDGNASGDDGGTLFDEVKAIADGRPGWEPFHAVKQVVKDINQVSQFIFDLFKTEDGISGKDMEILSHSGSPER